MLEELIILIYICQKKNNTAIEGSIAVSLYFLWDSNNDKAQVTSDRVLIVKNSY